MQHAGAAGDGFHRNERIESAIRRRIVDANDTGATVGEFQ